MLPNTKGGTDMLIIPPLHLWNTMRLGRAAESRFVSILSAAEPRFVNTLSAAEPRVVHTVSADELRTVNT